MTLPRHPTASSCSILARLCLCCGLAVGLGVPPARAKGQEAQAPAVTPPAQTAVQEGQTPASPSSASAPVFVEVTDRTGVRWTHNNGAFGQRFLPETLGPGVVVLDANGDGRSDLLFVNGRNFPDKPGEATTHALFLNQGGLRFQEATQGSGLDFSAYCLGGAAADIENDGDPDVYLACVGQDYLLRNDGGKFTDISRQAGLATEYGLGASVAFFDADRDGLVDIYATRYVTWTPETDLFCSFYGNSKSYCTPAIYKGVASRFYRNLGGGKFQDRTKEAGFFNPDAKALGVIPFDFNDDGWTDLAIACDTYQNLLFRNNQNGTFEEIGLFSGVGLSFDGIARAGMGIDAGDYERSGHAGLVITYFSREMVGLYRNLGKEFFQDIGPTSEVGRKTYLTLGWGTFFFDYDLDGWLDLLVANGHLDEQVDKVGEQIRYAQPQQLFHNEQGRFVEVTSSAGGDLAKPLVARGAAFADLDDDGDLDLVLTTNGGAAKVFENTGAGRGNWLRLSLQGTKSNRDGLGAKVEVTVNGATQTWQVRAGGSYLSQPQVDPTFGLGSTTLVDKIVIRWPSGKVQELSRVAANQRLRVVEP